MNVPVGWSLDSSFNEATLNLASIGAPALWAFILLSLALYFFWTSLKRIQSLRRKIFLISLRLLAFLFLVLVLLEPELELKKNHTLKNSIAVLVDDTKSMSIKTFPSGMLRKDIIHQTFKKNLKGLQSLEKNFQLDYYFISNQLEATSLAKIKERYHAKKLITNFESVFLQLIKQYQDKSLQGVILFSDGADLMMGSKVISPELSALLIDWEGPVYTFQAGSNYMFKDLAIEELESPDFGFVHQPVRLTVTLNASNMGNKNIPLLLKEGDRILLSSIVEVREGQSRYKVELEFSPDKLGKHIYSLTTPVFTGESVLVNNSKDFQVKVIRDRIRVLHLNGRPAWDSRFLREVLANHPKVDLLSFFILRTMGDDVGSPTSELSLIPFPTNLLFSEYLNSFDLIVFQNFNYDPFVDKRYLSNIKDFVENGGAFMMIGGELSFHGGGYKHTDIEEILPVRLTQTLQPFLNDSFKLKLSENLLHHPILQLERGLSANIKAWRSLPKLNGINVGLQPRRNAYVLASFEKGEKDYPLLVAGLIGKGRSLVMATDSSWNWNFLRAGDGGSGRQYHKIWNNLIAWLIDDPETRPLKLETDKESYREGESVLIRVRSLQEDYNPSVAKKVRLTIKMRSREVKSEIIKTDDNGNGSYQWAPMKEGFYTIKAKVESANNQKDEEIGFSVISKTAEFQKPRVNETLLRRIAEVSGGKYQELTENTDFSKMTFDTSKVEIKTHGKKIKLWNNWWTYGGILSLLFLDWFVRRKSGLS